MLRYFPHNLKLDIYIKKGAHSTEDEINKQINDRERIAAAIENQNLWKLVENCIRDDEWCWIVDDVSDLLSQRQGFNFVKQINKIYI